jgi:predicted amidohydrolase
VDTLVIATIQQRMQIPQSHAEYREELRRFLKIAAAKHARLVIFPELGGLVVAPPLLGDFRSTLIKRAEYGTRRGAGLWAKLVGSMAEAAAGWIKADLRLSLAGLMDVAKQEVWTAYCDLFGGLAKEYGITLVAPSAYLPDPADGVLRNLAAIFGEEGELLGIQPKVVLHPEDTDIAQAGDTWNVIATPVGRIGLIVGSDILYPEVGRLLAYQGADMLIVQGACLEPVLYNKIRAGVLARMQENQLYAAASFLIGTNRLSRRARTPYVGKSAIFAPQELTPRKNGVMVEMTSQHSEGVLTATWDFVALRALWEDSDTPVRRELPLHQAGQALAQLYSDLERLPRLLSPDELKPDVESVVLDAHGQLTGVPLLALDELDVRSSITSRWPLGEDASVEGELPEAAALEGEPLETLAAENWPESAGRTFEENEVDNGSPHSFSGEDETDEMDALRRPDEGKAR